MKLDKASDYSIPVHRPLLKRELIFGVSPLTMVILFCITVIVVVALRLYWFIIFPIIILFVLRYLTKKDEYLVEIIIDNLSKHDELWP